MKLAGKSVAQQKGFTLIELIMVVVILGVLSAFALPRFGNFRGNAQVSATNAARAAVDSASQMVHSQSLIAGNVGLASNNNPVPTVATDSGNVTLNFGYPAGTAAGIGAALQLTNVAVAYNAGVATFTVNNDANCTFTYTQSAAAGAQPVLSAVNANCGN